LEAHHTSTRWISASASAAERLAIDSPGEALAPEVWDRFLDELMVRFLPELQQARGPWLEWDSAGPLRAARLGADPHAAPHAHSAWACSDWTQAAPLAGALRSLLALGLSPAQLSDPLVSSHRERLQRCVKMLRDRQLYLREERCTLLSQAVGHCTLEECEHHLRCRGLQFEGIGALSAPELQLLECLHARLTQGVRLHMPTPSACPEAVERIAEIYERRWAEQANPPSLEFADPLSSHPTQQAHPVQCFVAASVRQEAEAVAAIVSEQLNRGLSPEAVLIVVPSRRVPMAFELRDCLAQRGIPVSPPAMVTLHQSQSFKAVASIAGVVEALRTPGERIRRDWIIDLLENAHLRLGLLPMPVRLRLVQVLQQSSLEDAADLESFGRVLATGASPENFPPERIRSSWNALATQLASLTVAMPPRRLQAEVRKLWQDLDWGGMRSNLHIQFAQKLPAQHPHRLHHLALESVASERVAEIFDDHLELLHQVAPETPLGLPELFVLMQVTAPAPLLPPATTGSAAVRIVDVHHAHGQAPALTLITGFHSEAYSVRDDAAWALPHDLLKGLPKAYRPIPAPVQEAQRWLRLATLIEQSQLAVLSYPEQERGHPQQPHALLLKYVPLPHRKWQPTQHEPQHEFQHELPAPSPAKTLPAPVAEQLAQLLPGRDNQHPISISALERALACRFKFFAHDVLHARPSEERGAAADARDRGTMLHEALEAAMLCLREQRKLRDLSPHEMIAHCVQAAATRLEERNLQPEADQHPIRLLSREATLHAVADALHEHFASGREFIDAELAFGRSAAIPALALRLESDPHQALYVTGRIDRIDRLSNGELAVIDYKSGSAARPVATHGSRYLQLPLYANVVQQALGKACTQAFYLTLTPRDGVKAVPASDAARIAIRTAADTAAHQAVEVYEKLLRADFNAHPIDPAICQSCDAKAVCRVGNKEALTYADGAPTPEGAQP
jgi:RecB family exonuclease